MIAWKSSKIATISICESHTISIRPATTRRHQFRGSAGGSGNRRRLLLAQTPTPRLVLNRRPRNFGTWAKPSESLIPGRFAHPLIQEGTRPAFSDSSDGVHVHYGLSVQKTSRLQVRPHGFIPDVSFGRELSNSTGRTFTCVDSGFAGARLARGFISIFI